MNETMKWRMIEEPIEYHPKNAKLMYLTDKKTEEVEEVDTFKRKLKDCARNKFE